MSIYTVLMHECSLKRFAVYKTTGDPNDQGTWAVVASSEVDFTDEVYSLWAVKDGTHIHVVTQEAVTGRVAYHDYNTGTDTWTRKNEENRVLEVAVVLEFIHPRSETASRL